MMRAAESGAAQRQRAHEALLAQGERGSERIASQGMRATQLGQESQRLQEGQRQFDESQAASEREAEAQRRFAADQAQRERSLKLSEAETEREFAAREEQKNRELTAAREGLVYQSREERLRAEMARGEEQTRGGMAPGEQGPPMPDMQQGPPMPTGPGGLSPEAEQRLGAQTGQGNEMVGGGRWIPNAERQQATRFEQERQAFKDQTERVKAEAYRDQVAASRMRASLEGDTEKVERLTTELQQPIISNTQKLNRFQKGEPTDNDWDSLKSMARAWSQDDQLIADAEAKQWTPRVRQFLNAQIAKDTLKFIGYTGTFPDVKKTSVDMTSPIMQQFTTAAGQIGGWMRGVPPGMTQWMGINDQEDKTSFVNRWAAAMTLSGMMMGDYEGAGGGGFGGMTPAAGQQGQGPEPEPDQALARQRMQEEAQRGSFHPYATDEATQRAIEARKRGEDVPPTDTTAFRRKFGGANQRPTMGETYIQRAGL